MNDQTRSNGPGSPRPAALKLNLAHQFVDPGLQFALKSTRNLACLDQISGRRKDELTGAVARQEQGRDPAVGVKLRQRRRATKRDLPSDQRKRRQGFRRFQIATDEFNQFAPLR